MSVHQTQYIAAGAIVFVILVIVGIKFRPRRLRVVYFQKKWKDLQNLLSVKDAWPEAVVKADKLLDEALKKKRFNGKNPGERRVAAQRKFSDNDGVWFGHKLRDRVVQNSEIKLRERDVKSALVAIRQALKDIGALPDDKSKK